MQGIRKNGGRYGHCCLGRRADQLQTIQESEFLLVVFPNGCARFHHLPIPCIPCIPAIFSFSASSAISAVRHPWAKKKSPGGRAGAPLFLRES